jgi:hypothetical protein
MVVTTQQQHRALVSRSPATSVWPALLLMAVSSACGSSNNAPPATETAGVGPTASVMNPAVAAPKAACGTGTMPCDATNLGGATCASMGVGSGMLLCDPVTCTFDTTMCMPMAPATGTGGIGAFLRPRMMAGGSDGSASGAGGASDSTAGVAGVASVSGSGGTHGGGSGGLSGSTGSAGRAGSTAGAGGTAGGGGSAARSGSGAAAH